MRYFEDFSVGMVVEMGPRRVTRDEILAFARDFDPQPFHLDEQAAERSIYGGLIASGWHTASLCMRMMVDGFVGDAASLGSSGVEELRWKKPVRPGDEIRLRMEVVEARRSHSKPDRGIVQSAYQLHNQKGELIMTYRAMGFYRCRAAA